jgi:hypothetical protein
MLHAIYLRAIPKGIWYLVSVSPSAQIALHDKQVALQDAIKHGEKEASVGIKSFETSWQIPTSLIELKEDERLLFS